MRWSTSCYVSTTIWSRHQICRRELLTSMKTVSPRLIARWETILKSWLPRAINRKCLSGNLAVAEGALRSAMHTASNEYSEALSSKKQTYQRISKLSERSIDASLFFTMEGNSREYWSRHDGWWVTLKREHEPRLSSGHKNVKCTIIRWPIQLQSSCAFLEKSAESSKAEDTFSVACTVSARVPVPEHVHWSGI